MLAIKQSCGLRTDFFDHGPIGVTQPAGPVTLS